MLFLPPAIWHQAGSDTDSEQLQSDTSSKYIHIVVLKKHILNTPLRRVPYFCTCSWQDILIVVIITVDIYKTISECVCQTFPVRGTQCVRQNTCLRCVIIMPVRQLGMGEGSTGMAEVFGLQR